MRRKRDTQGWLDFQPSNLKLTSEYFAKYEAISEWLDETPQLLDLVHRDLKRALSAINGKGRLGARFKYTSEQALRMCLCQVIEGQSLRGIVVRIDDSRYLRRFTRIYDGPMMDFTTLDRLRNAVHPQTWKKVNQALARAAVARGAITGDELRVDTTAVETDIHYPTDSGLLQDSYRTLGRLIESAREVDGDAVGGGRLHLRRVKRLHRKVGRIAARRGRKPKDLESSYSALIRSVEGICEWAASLSAKLSRRANSGRYGIRRTKHANSIAEVLEHYEALARRVVRQARARVLEGRPVPNEEKILSVFEPHTELIKRGKAGKMFEYGHMIQIQQVRGCFITAYEVFPKKPNESKLLPTAVENHVQLFGTPPIELSADKAYWPGKEVLAQLEEQVQLVAVGKMGRLRADERPREADPIYRLANHFRAGIEGTISFLKRTLGLVRCFNRGWENYVSTIATTILAHNLLVLARC